MLCQSSLRHVSRIIHSTANTVFASLGVLKTTSYPTLLFLATYRRLKADLDDVAKHRVQVCAVASERFQCGKSKPHTVYVLECTGGELVSAATVMSSRAFFPSSSLLRRNNLGLFIVATLNCVILIALFVRNSVRRRSARCRRFLRRKRLVQCAPLLSSNDGSSSTHTCALSHSSTLLCDAPCFASFSLSLGTCDSRHCCRRNSARSAATYRALSHRSTHEVHLQPPSTHSNSLRATQSARWQPHSRAPQQSNRLDAWNGSQRH